MIKILTRYQDYKNADEIVRRTVREAARGPQGSTVRRHRALAAGETDPARSPTSQNQKDTVDVGRCEGTAGKEKPAEQREAGPGTGDTGRKAERGRC
ncbi:hypothetical protein Tco_0567432 [Tanacetum coccineum]